MHQAAAFRVAYVLLGSAADAEDAAQEGFVRAYLAIARFRAGEPFRPWILEVIGNEARNRRRARGRREGMAERVVTAVRGTSGGGPPSPAPELPALAGETQAEGRAALATLDDPERLLVPWPHPLRASPAQTAGAPGGPAGAP